MNRRIANAWRAVGKLLRNPTKCLRQILQASQQEDFQQLVLQKYGIHRLPTVTLPALFGEQALQASIAPYTYLDGAALPTDILLLQHLVRRAGKACRFFEIGSWRGETLANIAPLVQSCATLNLSAEEMQAKGFSDAFIAAHDHFTKDFSNITRYLHDSTTFDFGQVSERFDVAFIDGDHSFEAVRADTQNIFKIMQPQNPSVVWHDYTFDTETVNYVVLAGILEGLPRAEHGHLYHIANTKSCLYTRAPLPTIPFEYPAPIFTTFELEVRAKAV